MNPSSTLSRVRSGLHTVEARVDDFDVRAVVVEGAERVLVWDTLAHPEQMGPATRLIADRPRVVAYSHADWDHVWGTAALGAVQEIVAHERCAQRFGADVPDALAGRRAAEPDAWDAVQLLPPTSTFAYALDVDLGGGVTVRLEHLPGHTPDCAVAWIPAWGVLLAGDTVETPLPVVNGAAAVPSWAAGLRRWAAEPGLELVVPAHGRIGGREVIEETVSYLEALMSPAPFELPRGLDPFYRHTHEENLRLMGA